MTNRVSDITAARLQHQRPCSDVGKLLPDYVVNLLADSAAEEVEDHMLACRPCRERFLTILRLRSEALARRAARDEEEEQKPDTEGADVVRIADFKK